MKNILIQSNIKPTKARAELLEIFSHSQKPLCFENIRGKISMDKATFYRNILLFENAKLIAGFEGIDKKRYFELQQNEHAHFFCSQCSDVFCLECVNIPKDERYVVKQVILNGICKTCSEQ